MNKIQIETELSLAKNFLDTAENRKKAYLSSKNSVSRDIALKHVEDWLNKVDAILARLKQALSVAPDAIQAQFIAESVSQLQRAAEIRQWLCVAGVPQAHQPAEPTTKFVTSRPATPEVRPTSQESLFFNRDKVKVGGVHGIGKDAKIDINGHTIAGQQKQAVPTSARGSAHTDRFGVPSAEPAKPAAKQPSLLSQATATLEKGTGGPENEASLRPNLVRKTGRPEHEASLRPSLVRETGGPEHESAHSLLPDTHAQLVASAPPLSQLSSEELKARFDPQKPAEQKHMPNVNHHDGASPDSAKEVQQAAPGREPASIAVNMSKDGTSINKISGLNGQNVRIINGVVSSAQSGHTPAQASAPAQTPAPAQQQVSAPPKSAGLLSKTTVTLSLDDRVATADLAKAELEANRNNPQGWKDIKNAIVDRITGSANESILARRLTEYKECIDLRINPARQWLSVLADTNTRTRIDDFLKEGLKPNTEQPSNNSTGIKKF